MGVLGWSSVTATARAQEAEPSSTPRDELLPAPPSPFAAPIEEAPQAPRPPPPPPRDTKVASAPPALPQEADPAPKPAEAPPGARLHDGFYLRFAIGANYGRAFLQTNRVSKPDVRIVGMGRAIDVWAGTTIPSGIVLGVNVGIADVFSDAADAGDGESTAARSLALQLGGFLDAYPNPREGYHFGGALAVAAVTAHADAVPSDYTGGGVGLSIFAGYDAWIASQLSLGGILRLGGAVTRESDQERGLDVTKQGTTYGAQVLATLVYH